MSSTLQRTRSPQQQAVIDQLAGLFDIDTSQVRFLTKGDPLKPWLSADVLMSIARQTGKFQLISSTYSEYIPEMRQLVYSATVVDPAGRSFIRSGAATVGEVLESGDEADEHSLASTRALNAALTAAGFNPLKPASAVLSLKLPPSEHAAADQSQSRLNDLKAIHKIAREKGLVVPFEDDPSLADMSRYRKFLAERFGGVNTAAGLGPADRAALINALRELPDQLAPASTDVAQVA